VVLYVLRRHAHAVVGYSYVLAIGRKEASPDLHINYAGAGVVAVLYQLQHGSCVIFDALATPCQHRACINGKVFGHFQEVYIRRS